MGAAATLVATYFWIKESRARARGELKVSAKRAGSPAASRGVAPMIGESAGRLLGAAAGRQF